MKDELNIEIFSAICQITSLYIKKQILDKQPQEKAFQGLNDLIQIFQEEHKEELESKDIDEQVFPHDQFPAQIPSVIENYNITKFYLNIKDHLKLKSLDKIVFYTLQSNDKKFVIFESFKVVSILFFYEFLLAQQKSMLTKEVQQKILDNCEGFEMVKECFKQPQDALQNFFIEDWLENTSQQIVEVFLRIVKIYITKFGNLKETHKLITSLLFQRQFKDSKFSKIDVFSIIRMVIEILGISLSSYKQSLFMRQTTKGIKAKSIEISQNSSALFNCPFVISQENDKINVHLYLTYSTQDEIDKQQATQQQSRSERLQQFNKQQQSVKSQKTIMLPNSKKKIQQSPRQFNNQNDFKVKDSLTQQNYFNFNEPSSITLNQQNVPQNNHHHSYSLSQKRVQNSNGILQNNMPQINSQQNFFQLNKNFENQIDQMLQKIQSNDMILNRIRFQAQQNTNGQKRFFSQEEIQQNQTQYGTRFRKNNNSSDKKLIRLTSDVKYQRKQTLPSNYQHQYATPQRHTVQQITKRYRISQQQTSNKNLPPQRNVVYKRVLNQQQQIVQQLKQMKGKKFNVIYLKLKFLLNFFAIKSQYQ